MGIATPIFRNSDSNTCATIPPHRLTLPFYSCQIRLAFRRTDSLVAGADHVDFCQFTTTPSRLSLAADLVDGK